MPFYRPTWSQSHKSVICSVTQRVGVAALALAWRATGGGSLQSKARQVLISPIKNKTDRETRRGEGFVYGFKRLLPVCELQKC